ncbi:MAG: hypothetical protein U0V48_04800 [Anaerolineales bacterium]
MVKEIAREDILRKIFSSAYSFKKLGYYGSKEKAVNALLKRKGFETYSTSVVTDLFEQALKVFADTTEFVDNEIKNKTPLSHLNETKVNRIMDKLRESLSRKNPKVSKEMIQFALNWVYFYYYLR